MSQQALLNALFRQNIAPFIQKTFSTISSGDPYLNNWHIAAIAWHLEQCVKGDIKRLIITLPPRSLKSIAASVAFPAWVLGLQPSKKIVCVSYSQELANKHAYDTRTVMQSDWYQQCFPNTRLSAGKSAVHDFKTSRKGYRLSTSIGGTLTGRGGNLIIIDDPHKADEVGSDIVRQGVIDWFNSTLLSRLDNKKEDVIIVIQQRLHENDLAGHLLEQGDWIHLNLPAIAEEEQTIQVGDDQFYSRQIGDVLHPQREPLEILDKIKRGLGSYRFAAQYQQNPAPLGGGLVQWNWFKRYKKAPSRNQNDLIVQSWDTASSVNETGDYSVCTTWLCKENQYYLLDVLRVQLNFPDLKQKMISHAETYESDLIIVEYASSGIPLFQEISSKTNLTIKYHTPRGDKISRMEAGTVLIEAGQILIPEEAPWLAEFQREVVTFPKGKHDDQIDSLSQFLYWARNRDYRQRLAQVRLTVITRAPSPSINDIFHTSIY